MLSTRNILIAGAAVVLGLGGAFWTNARETNSPCSDDIYMARIHNEMRQEFLDDSVYLANLRAGAESEDVSAEDRGVYAAAARKLTQEINKADVVGRMKHPNNEFLKTCYLKLEIGDVLAEFDLGQRTVLGFDVDRGFGVEARFNLRFEEVTGVELQSRIEAQRKDQYLVMEIAPGETVETALVAKASRREIKVNEPEFLQINYSTSITAEDGYDAGYYGR